MRLWQEQEPLGTGMNGTLFGNDVANYGFSFRDISATIMHDNVPPLVTHDMSHGWNVWMIDLEQGARHGFEQPCIISFRRLYRPLCQCSSC
jgi:hypothetical protein